MKRSKRTLSIPIALVVLALTACERKEGGGHGQKTIESTKATDVEPGVTFNAKKGLSVLPQTAEIIGLQLADVEERAIKSEFQFSAQVYRASAEAPAAALAASSTLPALASGNVSRSDAGKLHEGQAITVRSATNGFTWTGRVAELRRDLERARGQVEILLQIADPKQLLVTGAFVEVSVALGGERSVVSVPPSAIFRTMDGDFVYTVSGEHFMRAQVRLGVVNQDFAEVTEGLYAGDQVVAQPVMTLWLAELQSVRGGKACADGH